MRSALAAPLVVLSFLTLSAPSSPAGDEKAPPAVAKIALTFKLDPRLTYTGERWVSPPTYTGAAAQDTVEVSASAVDAAGKPTKASIDWSPSDPEMLTVTPPRGERVKIAVKRAGESSVTVKSGGVSRKLTVNATQKNGVWQVTISQ
ncbi:MAG TPA: hypothetical protein VFR85_16060 [Anaeromyxobacteraceae bacterium]|nr:hypothetical protein [Anaeromyxobacteraceae bacterium]